MDRAIAVLEIDWPTAIELLEHTASLAGDAVTRRRGSLPLLATIIGQPVAAYAGRPDEAELDRFLMLVRELAQRCVDEMGGIVLEDRGGDVWALGHQMPLLAWYWTTARRVDRVRVKTRKLSNGERERLRRHVLYMITCSNTAAFDGHLRHMIPELCDVDTRA